MIRVYIASKIKHGLRWRQLCANTPWVQFHARWLKHNAIGTPDDGAEASQFWLQDEQDIRDADVVIVYAEEGEHLRGALVEAGMALAYGVPVIVVGSHPDYGTWQYHPGVTRLSNLDLALLYVRDRVRPGYQAHRAGG